MLKGKPNLGVFLLVEPQTLKQQKKNKVKYFMS